MFSSCTNYHFIQWKLIFLWIRYNFGKICSRLSFWDLGINKSQHSQFQQTFQFLEIRCESKDLQTGREPLSLNTASIRKAVWTSMTFSLLNTLVIRLYLSLLAAPFSKPFCFEGYSRKYSFGTSHLSKTFSKAGANVNHHVTTWW